ncbi:MAG TPA: c-type cytochrome, partial [Pseudomonadales bacterium]
GIEQQLSPAKSRVLVFKLGADQQLPPLAKTIEWPELPPLPDLSEEQLQQGLELYHQNCSGCHGFNVVSNGVIPDLRRMHPVFHQQFNAIVLEGALQGVGMVGFKDVLNADEAELIRSYILSRAHEDAAARAQPAWWQAIKQWFFNLLAKLIGWLV